MKSTSLLARRAFFEAAVALRAHKRRLASLRDTDAVVILNLHQVAPPSNPFWPALAPELFSDLVSFLARNCRVARLGDLATLEPGEPVVVLSFDDGLCSFVEYAMPILAERGLHGNLNVIVKSVETGTPPWHVQLYDFLAGAPNSLLGDVSSAVLHERLPVATDVDRERFGRKLVGVLKSRSRAEREESLQELRVHMERDETPTGTRVMSLRDVQEAAQQHEVGAHSYSHASMGFESTTFFRDDLGRCETFFTERVGSPARIYAFPNGSHRDEHIDILRDRGFEHILLVNERESTLASRVHPRFTFHGASRAEVLLRGLGWRREGGVVSVVRGGHPSCAA